MTPRKNTSIRLSDGESSGLKQIAAEHGVKESVLMQKAIRRFLRDYERVGPTVLIEDDTAFAFAEGEFKLRTRKVQQPLHSSHGASSASA